jgi:uncharacterized protein
MTDTQRSGLVPDSSTDQALADQLDAFRRARADVERSVLPLATSVDGVSFGFQASLHDLALRRGGYVVLQHGGTARLGQITELRADSAVTSSDGIAGAGTSLRVRLATGHGTVLEEDAAPFHDASVRPATPAEVGDWVTRTSPSETSLTIGELLLAPGVPAALDSAGLGRHTFMCGQSGSGKSYSLGVLLERVLVATSLPVVVLDPNSDYLGLSRIRPDADPLLAARYERVRPGISVWSNGPLADHPLRLSFPDLGPALQAAVLGLDPIADREEYAVLCELLEQQRDGKPLVGGVEGLMHAATPGARALGLRASNLGVLGWRVWSAGERSLVSEIRDLSARCTVVDLGSLDTPEERRLVAQAVLSTLWESRHLRRPCLIVVDEAHNVCPADPGDAITRLSTEQAIQLAGEGRKYGLFLLTSTQRPHKVHEHVVSQCDNLLLMRMNAQADVAGLGELLSFAPPGLMVGAPSFRPGHALVAGRFMPRAAYVRIGRRICEEGGGDVPSTWTAAR